MGLNHSTTMMKIVTMLLTMSVMIIVTTASTVPLSYTPNIDPNQFYFGASNPAPCCRSKYPDEFGSCQANEHCLQPTAPFCSAFGYCTQQKQYGYGGCVPCQYQSPVTSPYQ